MVFLSSWRGRRKGNDAPKNKQTEGLASSSTEVEEAAGAPRETDLMLPEGKDSFTKSHIQFGCMEWLGNLKFQFGHQLIILLFLVQHVLKGFVDSFSKAADPYLYKMYNVPAPTMQIYSTVTSLPWAMKPAIGLISDVLPIMGYNKAPYFLIASVLGVTGYIVIGSFPTSSMTVQSMVICMFMTSFQVSTCDLLSEAKYAEKIQSNPKYGPDLLTYVWFGLSVGGLIAVMLSGETIMHFGPKACYFASAFPAAMVIPAVSLGYLQERRLAPEEVRAIRGKFLKQKEACALCILMLCGTLTLTATGLTYRDPYINAAVAIACAVIMVTSFSIVLSPTIAKFNAFSVIQGALSLSISGASFYFYTDTAEQYPEGPHFTPFFFNTVMGVGGATCSLLGIYMYNRYMSSWKYRHLLIGTNLAFSALCVMDILMFARINVRWGISDHFFVLGSTTLETIVSQWMWMPQVVILSYLCPKGMEATMYALLAGCANLGNSIASNVGAALLDWFECKPTGSAGESAQFENLWKASTIATVLPLITVLVLYWLVPDARQNERLIGDDSDDATAGSLWRRWTGNA